MAKPTKAKSIARLQRQLAKIPALKKQRHGSPEFTKWRRDTEIAVTNTFGEDTQHIEEFASISYSARFVVSGARDSYFQQAYVRGLERAEAFLQSMIEEIEEYWEDDDQSMDTPEYAQMNQSIDLTKVFIVHGRDTGSREMVARFLELLKLEPVILQEQPDKGLTVIEKFEKYSQVGFAVVLFTRDDIGALKEALDSPQFRARQNVILELGYFLGKLGRKNVRVLLKGDVEIPSDYYGVLTTRIDDAGAWQGELIREMKSAGLDVDANRAFV